MHELPDFVPAFSHHLEPMARDGSQFAPTLVQPYIDAGSRWTDPLNRSNSVFIVRHILTNAHYEVQRDPPQRRRGRHRSKTLTAPQRYRFRPVIFQSQQTISSRHNPATSRRELKSRVLGTRAQKRPSRMTHCRAGSMGYINSLALYWERPTNTLLHSRRTEPARRIRQWLLPEPHRTWTWSVSFELLAPRQPPRLQGKPALSSNPLIRQ